MLRGLRAEVCCGATSIEADVGSEAGRQNRLRQGLPQRRLQGCIHAVFYGPLPSRRPLLMPMSSRQSPPLHLRCGNRSLDLSTPLVMGVINVTPDSFSDGGRFLDPAAAVDQARRMVEEGAAIVDVGGESTRPGANEVLVKEELRRVMPVVEKLVGSIDAVISVDTRKPEVMRAAVAAGAGLINDVGALSAPRAIETIASSDCAVCLMHMQGEPRTMQLAPTYVDVVNEVKAFLRERVRACTEGGIAVERIAIDPGFGFGKTLEHNLQLLRRLRELANLSGLAGITGSIDAGELQGVAKSGGVHPPVLVGLSRKSMLANILGNPKADRLHGSITLAVLAVLNGARIVRTHDVRPTLDAIRTVMAVQGESV
jgi:dihydropteroate synthase